MRIRIRLIFKNIYNQEICVNRTFKLLLFSMFKILLKIHCIVHVLYQFYTLPLSTLDKKLVITVLVAMDFLGVHPAYLVHGK